jgi:hypothetical protein
MHTPTVSGICAASGLQPHSNTRKLLAASIIDATHLMARSMSDYECPTMIYQKQLV